MAKAAFGDLLLKGSEGFRSSNSTDFFGGVSVAESLRLFRSVLTVSPPVQPAKLQGEEEKKIKPEQVLSRISVKPAVHPFKE